MTRNTQLQLTKDIKLDRSLWKTRIRIEGFLSEFWLLSVVSCTSIIILFYFDYCSRYLSWLFQFHCFFSILLWIVFSWSWGLLKQTFYLQGRDYVHSILPKPRFVGLHWLSMLVYTIADQAWNLNALFFWRPHFVRLHWVVYTIADQAWNHSSDGGNA